MNMLTTRTQLTPLDYVLDDDEIFTSLNRYSQTGIVSAGETDDEDNANIPGPYVKTKKKKGSGKKKGGKKSGSKKKKGGKKKKK